MRRGQLYVLLLSPHGLIRSQNLELGRDADTGGQTKYVVELAKALAEDPRVERVDLVTRRVEDARISPDYAEPTEELAPGAHIVRLDFGPRRYLRKESLWPYLDVFVDQVLGHLRRVRRVPDLIHAHYADAGLVGAHLESLLRAPLVFTGHSLGRVKLQRLLDQGLTKEESEERFSFQERIEAEETALDHAALVVASTRQEAEDQYAMYQNHQPERTVVIPPGTDLSRFRPPRADDPEPPVAQEIDRFLNEPDKPLILAIARPDPRKNLLSLVDAYARNDRLREMANLAIVAGTRDDLADMKAEPRREVRRLLLAIDRYDLYGKVAYPKHHSADDVPDLYRLAARRGGVFVNPALTEPFGLTLIEAAASGLPVVATADGGPRDILEACENGVLIDALDVDALSKTLQEALEDRKQWKRWSRNGPEGARRHFRWSAHVQKYLESAISLGGGANASMIQRPIPLTLRSHVLISDIDGTLIGDQEGLDRLLARLHEAGWGLGVATGRTLSSATEVLEEWGVRAPAVTICAVGAEIYYGPDKVKDTMWGRHLDYRWQPELVKKRVLEVAGDGIELQPASEQRRHKISFNVDPQSEVQLSQIRRELRAVGLHARLVFSHGAYLDVLPIRCSKGHAIRWVAQRWGIDLESIVVAGDSGNDRDMLVGRTPAIVVGNHSRELDDLADQPDIHFASAPRADGILEVLEERGWLQPQRLSLSEIV